MATITDIFRGRRKTCRSCGKNGYLLEDKITIAPDPPDDTQCEHQWGDYRSPAPHVGRHRKKP